MARKAARRKAAPKILQVSSRELREHFQRYRDRIAGIQEKLGRREALVKRQRAMLITLTRRCPACYMRVMVMSWNTKVMLLVCDNSKCAAYRRPLEAVSLEEIEALLSR